VETIDKEIELQMHENPSETKERWRAEKKTGRGARGPREKKYKVFSNTGFKGVINTGSGKRQFAAQVTYRVPKSLIMKKVHVGSFATAEEANIARIKFITDLL
jgi:hypothetical protein